MQLVFFVENEQARDAHLWRDRICDLLPPYVHPNHVAVVDRFPSTTTASPTVGQLEKLPRPPDCAHRRRSSS